MLDKKSIAIGILAFSGGLSGIAAAEDSQGFYAGAGIGRNTIKDSSVKFNASDTAFKIFGGYTVSRYFSAEASYINGGSPSETISGVRVKADVSGFDASLIGSFDLSPKFSLLGRLGVLFWDEKVSAPTFGLSANETGNDISYGIGAGFNLTPNTKARLEWQSANTELDVSVITLSFAWKFSK